MEDNIGGTYREEHIRRNTSHTRPHNPRRGTGARTMGPVMGDGGDEGGREEDRRRRAMQSLGRGRPMAWGRPGPGTNLRPGRLVYQQGRAPSCVGPPPVPSSLPRVPARPGTLPGCRG